MDKKEIKGFAYLYKIVDHNYVLVVKHKNVDVIERYARIIGKRHKQYFVLHYCGFWGCTLDYRWEN